MRMNAEICCSLKVEMAIKSERNSTKRYTHTILTPKTTPKLNSIAINFNWIPFKLNHRRMFGKHHTGVLLFSISNLLQVRLWIKPLPSSIHIDKNLNYWFSASLDTIFPKLNMHLIFSPKLVSQTTRLFPLPWNTMPSSHPWMMNLYQMLLVIVSWLEVWSISLSLVQIFHMSWVLGRWSDWSMLHHRFLFLVRYFSCVMV